MSINYTPTRGEYTPLKPFRFWCQKVLPLVYDESLSYYELLCKVVDYLNKTMEDVDTLSEDMDGLYESYTLLQNYVNHYFDNLDIQTEINNKLDKMAATGALGNIIDPVVEATVTEWLDLNVAQETGYVIDKSLTIGDAAADAEVVGDEFKRTEMTVGTIVNGLRNGKYHFANTLSTNLIDIIDLNGNIICSINYKGNLILHEFDSGLVPYRKPIYSAINYDFAICDSNNNIAFAIVNGIGNANQHLYGKKVSILSDSISAYNGTIPSGYAYFYPSGNVNNADEMWWKQLCDDLNLTLVKNASWSGSGVCGDSTGTAECACSTARISDLKDGTTIPDIILCYISTNDWYKGKTIGSFTPESTIPSDGTINTISDGYALMLYKIRTTYPNAQVYCFTSLEGRTVSGDTTYPIVNSAGDTIHEVNHAITEIAHIFGCKVIDLNTCGIHYWNVSSFTTDGTLHPNERGQKVIKETAKQELINEFHNI